MLNQYNSVPSRFSDQDQISMTKNNQDQVKIAVLRSGVILDVQFKVEVNSLLKIKVHLTKF